MISNIHVYQIALGWKTISLTHYTNVNTVNVKAVMLYEQKDYLGLLKHKQKLLWSELSQSTRINTACLVIKPTLLGWFCSKSNKWKQNFTVSNKELATVVCVKFEKKSFIYICIYIYLTQTIENALAKLNCDETWLCTLTLWHLSWVSCNSLLLRWSFFSMELVLAGELRPADTDLKRQHIEDP